MLISLSLWTFLLLVADPTFPHARKSLISVQISSKSRSGSSWFCWPRKSNPCRNRCFPSHLSPQGCTSRFCHCHFVGWTHMCRVNRGNIGGVAISRGIWQSCCTRTCLSHASRFRPQVVVVCPSPAHSAAV